MRLYKTQYSFRISGNRGYDSNRVRFHCVAFTLSSLPPKNNLFSLFFLTLLDIAAKLPGLFRKRWWLCVPRVAFSALCTTFSGALNDWKVTVAVSLRSEAFVQPSQCRKTNCCRKMLLNKLQRGTELPLNTHWQSAYDQPVTSFKDRLLYSVL